MPFTEHFYSAQDGLKLYFRAYGRQMAGQPSLLLLGGINRNAKDHHDIAKKLAAAAFHVICPDYRGRGRSAYDANWRNYHPTTYLNDLRHLLALLNLHKIVAIGTSMGGLLTMALSAVIPTALSGAVLNDIGPDVSEEGLQRIAHYLGDDTSYDNWSAAIAHIQGAWNDPSIKTEADWRKNAKETFREGDDGRIYIDWDPKIALALKRDDGSGHDLWPLYRGLGNRPTLLIRGAVSDILSEETRQRMSMVLPDTTALTIPETGHAPRLDALSVSDPLIRFLEKFRP